MTLQTPALARGLVRGLRFGFLLMLRLGESLERDEVKLVATEQEMIVDWARSRKADNQHQHLPGRKGLEV
jgi:hypothetical protein